MSELTLTRHPEHLAVVRGEPHEQGIYNVFVVGGE